MNIDNKMHNNQTKVKSRIDNLVSLFKKGMFKETLAEAKVLSKEFKDIPLIYNILGMVQIRLNNFEDSIQNFNKAIELDLNYVEAYNNLGSVLNHLGKFEEAVKNYKEAIKLRPQYANAYNNLAGAFNDLGRFEEAIENYNKVIEISPNFFEAEENIIKILTFYKPKNAELNKYTKTNSLLQKINFSYNSEVEIQDEDVVSFYKKCNEIISSNFNNIEFNLSQIWRRNTVDLNCTRHFKVFNSFKVIPKYCFGCFKVQIELSSLLELFKLYFVFDDLKLPSDNTRKCMVEMRPIAGGTYKGLIYCFGHDEAVSIYKQLNEILNKNISNKIKLKIRRGCTEFGIEHPKYKKIDQNPESFMKYNEDWRKKEKIIDEKIPKKNRSNQRVLKNTISGITINDALIMKNWLIYAKEIGDLNYKKFDKNISTSKYIESEITKQLEFRKKEFSNSIN